MEGEFISQERRMDSQGCLQDLSCGPYGDQEKWQQYLADHTKHYDDELVPLKEHEVHPESITR